MATKFRYLKWHIAKKRATKSNDNTVQLSEFQLLDAKGDVYPWPSNTSVTSNPVGLSGETAEKIIDGQTSTKLCVAWTTNSSQTGSLEIVIDVGSGNEINLSKYNRYCYYTANDEESRDPISWTLYGSDDVSEWEVLDTQSDLSNIPTTRYTQAGVWEMDVESENYIFQPGIVGKTNVVEGAVIPDTHEQLVNYTMIYHLGDECEELTGGFGGCTGYRSTGYSGSAPTVTKNADHIHITHSASNTLGSMLTANKIDLTDFARLAAYAYSNTSGNTYAWANASYISARSGSGLSGGGVSLSSNATFTGWKTLDLTSVTGEYYLGTEHYWYGVAQTNRLYCMALFNGDDYNTLCDLAGVSTFATVDALIADTNAISTILSKQNAVNFMAKQCTGDFMAAFLASADCLSLLESSPYKNTIKNNEHWAKFLDLVA